jgi:uncharacterized protein YyaL (SSP411 family)
MTKPRFTNQLISESSPYLLQHAHNPVNWFPWNDATLERARKEDKLIIISIGYASCHWCHVMEHESFEDEEVAQVMNADFINIKIDREERPDIDQIYMQAVQMMTGRGGWPLNCIALPDGRPIWGGTYFPKAKWMNALSQLAALFREDREKMTEYAEKLTQGIRETEVIEVPKDRKAVGRKELEWTVNQWMEQLDFDLGGRMGAPKFPMPVNLQFQQHFALMAGRQDIREYVDITLSKMALGGIFDQVGGGFSRYSVDRKWHVPHFEKMLYDNGQLVSLYSRAYQATGYTLYREVVFQTIEFIERELTDPDGGFYASLDADSLNAEGQLEEGAFYVWTREELIELLGEEFEEFAVVYSIDDYGHWEEGRYVLIKRFDLDELALKLGMDHTELRAKDAVWRERLLRHRERRERPRLDDKILTSWNALMLKGYAEAFSIFGEGRFKRSALKNAKFITTKLMQANGLLFRSHKDGKSSINAYLEDYATLIDAFILLYEAVLDERWLAMAKQLTDTAFDHFFDLESSLFFFTSDMDTALISRKKELEDNVIPASNSIMAHNLFRLSRLYSNHYYKKVYGNMLHALRNRAMTYPSGHANWLRAMALEVGEFYEVALAGNKAMELLQPINSHYIPNKLIAGAKGPSRVPLMKDRYVADKTLIYVCMNGSCQLPTSDPEEALKLIDRHF